MGVASGCWQLCRDRHFGIAWKQPGDSINCCGTQVRQVGEALMKHNDQVGKKECLVEVVQVREPADESTGRQGGRRIMRPPAEEVNRWQRTSSLWITDLSIPWIQAICRTTKYTEDNSCLADGWSTKKDSGDGSEDGV
jgi:hypothetical protein